MTREEKLEMKKALELRTMKFAARVFRYLDSLPKAVSSKVIAFQLGKSASSIGANYREANRAESTDDFVHKMSIALKECSESHYWLQVLLELRPTSDNCKNLLNECEELLKIFQSSDRTSRAKRETFKSNKAQSTNRQIDESTNSQA